MDRFDDPRSRKRNNADDPRNTRIREHDDEVKNGKPQKLKSVKELIAEEIALEGEYKKEKAGITENGKLSPRSALLQMAQREELFDKMCDIYDKYRKKFQDSYENYHRSLASIKAEREEFGKSMYRQGYYNGISKGSSDKADELMHDIEYSRRSIRRSKIVSCILGVYGVFASVAVLALIM